MIAICQTNNINQYSQINWLHKKWLPSLTFTTVLIAGATQSSSYLVERILKYLHYDSHKSLFSCQ